MIVLGHVMREQQAGVYVVCRGQHGPGELEQGGHQPWPDPGAWAHESWPGQVSLSNPRSQWPEMRCCLQATTTLHNSQPCHCPHRPDKPLMSPKLHGTSQIYALHNQLASDLSTELFLETLIQALHINVLYTLALAHFNVSLLISYFQECSPLITDDSSLCHLKSAACECPSPVPLDEIKISEIYSFLQFIHSRALFTMSCTCISRCHAPWPLCHYIPATQHYHTQWYGHHHVYSLQSTVSFNTLWKLYFTMSRTCIPSPPFPVTNMLIHMF